MRTLGFCLLLLAFAGCATLEKHPHPLTADDLVARAKSGASAKAMIDEIFRTDTLIALNAAETVRLHEAGVPDEVLDYLQKRQIDELRLRDRFFGDPWYGPGFHRGFGFGPCPFPHRRGFRGGPWC
jgi:hypothetical protein